MKKLLNILLLMVLITTSACSQNNTQEQISVPHYTKAPQDYTAEMAIENGDYVNVHGNISNEEVVESFVQKVTNGENSSFRMVEFTIEGDPIITDISYNNDIISVTLDTTRDKFGSGKITTREYKNLIKYEDESIACVIVADFSEISKEDFEKGFDGVILEYELKE